VSLHPRHAKRIYGGTKPYEFRRKCLQIPEGSWAFIYETLPVGAVTGLVKFTRVHRGGLDEIRAIVAPVADIIGTGFENYLEGASNVCALKIGQAERLKTPLTLQDLRREAPDFRPPQSIASLASKTGKTVWDLWHEAANQPRRSYEPHA
jgi:predicted transcriptional regulator